jgi:hypothetical protein
VYRCKVIPLVSREFYRIHNDYPPQRKVWLNFELVKPPVITWFLKIAPSVETMNVFVWDEWSGLLPQMLATAAIAAPKLRELHVRSVNGDWVGAPILDTLSLLSQIK